MARLQFLLLLPFSMVFATAGQQMMRCDFESKATCPGLVVRGDWETTDGQHPANVFCPLVDNTIKTNRGHYLYIANYSSRPGKVMTLVNSASTERRKCLEFWYFLHGPRTERIVGSITLTLSMGTKLQSLWFKAAESHREWRRVHIDLPQGSFNVTIEAYLVNYRNDRVVALDDIKIYDCERTGASQTARNSERLLQCSFENGNLCGFRTGDRDVYTWQRADAGAKTKSTLLPRADKTFGNASGHFIYAVASSYEGSAKLYLPEVNLSSDITYCLAFYYNRPFRGMAPSLYVYKINGSDISILWSDNKVDTASKWTWAAIPLPSSTKRLVFEMRSIPGKFIPGSARTAAFALDDVVISACPVVRASEVREGDVYRTSLHCDFRNGEICDGRIVNTTTHAVWKIENSTTSSGVPKSASEFVLAVSSSISPDVNTVTKTVFHLPQIWPFHKTCMKFNLFMNKGFRDMLEIMVSGDAYRYADHVIWVKTGGSGRWESFVIELPLSKSRVSFVFSKRARHASLVALDGVIMADCEHLRSGLPLDTSYIDVGKSVDRSRDKCAGHNMVTHSKSSRVGCIPVHVLLALIAAAHSPYVIRQFIN